MTHSSEDFILTYAYSKGVKISFADVTDSIWEDGIHIFKPTMPELLAAVKDAIRFHQRLVMIHDNPKTWPFTFRY